jgi:hypothetical protein
VALSVASTTCGCLSRNARKCPTDGNVCDCAHLSRCGTHHNLARSASASSQWQRTIAGEFRTGMIRPKLFGVPLPVLIAPRDSGRSPFCSVTAVCHGFLVFGSQHIFTMMNCLSNVCNSNGHLHIVSRSRLQVALGCGRIASKGRSLRVMDRSRQGPPTRVTRDGSRNEGTYSIRCRHRDDANGCVPTSSNVESGSKATKTNEPQFEKHFSLRPSTHVRI